MQDNLGRLYAIIAKVLVIDPNTITNKTAPEDIDTWDSYNALMLVSELETKFNVHFTIDEVVAVKNVGDVKDALQRHGIEI